MVFIVLFVMYRENQKTVELKLSSFFLFKIFFKMATELYFKVAQNIF